MASPVLAAYDPEPDYFFHWYRDSAVVMDALRLLQDVCRKPRTRSRILCASAWSWAELDGRLRRRLARGSGPDFARFLRPDLDSAHGAAIGAETRVNPDGTLDITDWPRPQHDGPALRALP